ncbi:hypothetical protein K458DRAFT_423528 [Lentithecium fluviatile CBS 122367]|uniref:Uncharacterized protein n=1 Tax=Lentithecium fluviatile CBS 122367 TaxID=1168545 RepID=A0A6G1IJ28_9PLEO|nr:hypothetical protein K458DRAFT_423528 [Lentithecium fluviatile CBS 122367]
MSSLLPGLWNPEEMLVLLASLDFTPSNINLAMFCRSLGTPAGDSGTILRLEPLNSTTYPFFSYARKPSLFLPWYGTRSCYHHAARMYPANFPNILPSNVTLSSYRSTPQSERHRCRVTELWRWEKVDPKALGAPILRHSVGRSLFSSLPSHFNREEIPKIPVQILSGNFDS